MISEFENQLYGAFRALELVAAGNRQGGLEFCCPRCATPVLLEVADGIVSCPACAWGATGSAWEIAHAAAKDGRVK